MKLLINRMMEPFLVGFGASGVEFGAAMWGSEVSFANNGVRRSVLQIMGFGGQKCGAHDC